MSWMFPKRSRRPITASDLSDTSLNGTTDAELQALARRFLDDIGLPKRLTRESLDAFVNAHHGQPVVVKHSQRLSGSTSAHTFVGEDETVIQLAESLTPTSEPLNYHHEQAHLLVGITEDDARTALRSMTPDLSGRAAKLFACRDDLSMPRERLMEYMADELNSRLSEDGFFV